MFKKSKRFFSSDVQSISPEISAEFDRDKLASALLSVSAAQIDPDIGWVQLSFSGGKKVIISSISHNLAIKCEIEAPYSGQGVIKVSGKQFSDYVKQLPSTKVFLKAELPSRIQLKCGRSSAKIQLVHDQSQSKIDIPDAGTSIKIKGNFIERWVSSFKDFVSVDDNRFYANGALIWAERNSEGVLHAVASDALRLAKASLTEGIQILNLDNSQVLVPKKALDELKRVANIMPDTDFILKWHEKELFFSVEADDYTMFAKCIAGQYPPYEAAIPQQINTEIQLDLKSIQDSVKRSLLFADKNKVMKFHFENSLLTMASSTPGQKEGEEVIEMSSSIASPFEVNYNGHLIIGILGVLSGSRVNFAWENMNRPVKITGESQRGLEVFYLLVPARF
ncbi:DNA polymerase III subunit beta [Pigmentibacter sp. JX0631]|uniref:DNA polymerase III subunit beta n=1 Tax=Pigmentibacter sp. JX0631 TaxID=2976982 RepID=UPI0024683C3B|nr:DNA polymerase III subunit beta [Pigmentibacter sp. JX0631]WGL61387.1 DNA polymerase III subunit beta [Pigmentibacter sp. JX0631]